MKKFHKYFLPLLLVILIAFVSTCKKDDDDEPEFVNPSFAGQNELVTPPDGLATSEDIYAIAAYSYVSLVNAYANLFGSLVPPPNATKIKSTNKSTEGSITYTWSDGIYTVWITYTETSTKYIWEYDVDEGEGRYHLIYAEEQKDGLSGLIKFNDIDYEPEWDVVIEWAINNDGSVSWSLTNVYENIFLEIMCYADQSGYVKYYENSVLLWHIIWDAIGNGSWYDYSTEPPTSGSWSVS